MTTPDEYPARPGEILLGKYRVESVLGRGGMGVVVAARHLTLDDRVAIKLLLPECVNDVEFVQRFLREARAAVRIRSQHVARVSDVGTMENGAPYMILEYLEGQTLAEVLRATGPLPHAVAIELVLQACEALAEAHTLGIVHRDVKPGNLFLTHHADGSPCVKVLDFGVSKVQDGQEHALTQTGAVLGSPFYMSPEHLRSARDVDARADIYSVGVVLYELLTGRTPFTGVGLPQLIYSIMHDRPQPLRAWESEIPEGVEAVVLRAMAHERDERFGSVADLAVALAPFAPAASMASVDRICGVFGDPRCAIVLADGLAVGASPDTLRASMGPSIVAAAAGSPTNSGLGATHAPPARARWRGVMLVGLGLASSALGFFAWRGPERAATVAAGGMTIAPASPLAPASAVDGVPVASPSMQVDESPSRAAPLSGGVGAPDAEPPPTAAGAPRRRSQTPGVAPAAAPKGSPPKTSPRKSDPFNRDVF